MDRNAGIVAKVGTVVITEADVDATIAALGQRGEAYRGEQGRKAVVEQLVNKALLLCDARKNLYEFDPAFKAQLETIKEEMLANFAIEKAVSGVTVTDDEVKAYYEAHKDELVSEETVNASHILVDSEEKANELLSSITAGDITFEDAARKHSSCPSSQNGGNLGDFSRGQMVPEFDKAVFEMKEGEVAGPVKTQFGYHLIRLNHKHAPQSFTYEQIKDQLKATVLSEKRQAAYRSKLNQLKILYPVDLY